MKKLVEKLINKNIEIATMESCTGGALASEITNVEGASSILKYSAVTYSNDAKIMMGVSKKVIDKYSVYSKETAREMAYHISKFINSDIGVGITGKLNRYDPKNNSGLDNEVFVSIYYQNKYHDLDIIVDKLSRKENKSVIIEKITTELLNILDEKN